MSAGEPERVHVIAEAGTNHGGDPATARRLIDIAARAGADSVKFQLIHPESLYVPRLLEGDREVPNEVIEKRRAQMLPDGAYEELATYARQTGISLSASVFDRAGLDVLEAIDAPFVKVASVDLNNGPFLEEVASRGRRIVLSTGMSTLGEIHEAVEILTKARADDLVLLHCVSVYPCPVEATNIGFVEMLRREFGVPVGFSDHTESSTATVMAVALGASWIEKHVTYDRSAEGFDHHYALEPEGFADFVDEVRAAEGALRPADPKVGAAEAHTRERARRSLCAARPLRAGETLGRDDVLVVRPAGPLAPNDLYALDGRRLATDVPRFAPLRWEQFE